MLDNDFLYNKGEMDFGVRVSYPVNKDNICVERVDEPVIKKFQQKIIVNERRKKLKYEI